MQVILITSGLQHQFNCPVKPVLQTTFYPKPMSLLLKVGLYLEVSLYVPEHMMQQNYMSFVLCAYPWQNIRR